MKARAVPVLFLAFSARALPAQSGSVEVWIRTFIPDPAHAGQGSGFTSAMPSGGSGSMVRLLNVDASVPNVCFATDNRGFSSDPARSARLETRFTLTLRPDGTAAVSPSQGRTTAAVTTKVDCTSGAALAQKAGSVDRDNLGTPAVAQGVVQVVGQAQGRNLLTALGALGPAIDYSFDLQWEPASSSLTATVNFGSFPAFEMYARQPGGPWQPVLQRLPSGTPWSLGADAFGINTEHVQVKVTVPGMAGRWRSPAPEQRFTVELSGTRARWTERNAAGQVLTREVPLRELPDGRFRIERDNDAEVLTFLGFQPSLRTEILARNPQPSFMILSWDGNNVRGDWSGLLVTKDNNAHLKDLFQPGTQPPKAFMFTRLP